MSFDFALRKICSHEIMFENSVLDSSRRIVRFKSPPSSSRVTVYLNSIPIPSSGLRTSSEYSFILQEPYRIRQGKNDTLYVGIIGQSPKIVQIPSGSQVFGRDIAQEIQKVIPELSISVENGRIKISSRDFSSFCFFDPRWEDKSFSLPSTQRIIDTFKYFGINPGRIVSSKSIFPGWDIVHDEDSPVESDRVIQFSRPIKNADCIPQVSYFAEPASCKRCNGSKIEYDYTISNNTYEIVKESDLLLQELDKFLFTRIGSHWKWTWLGSPLVDRIGTKNISQSNFTNSMINLDISQAFRVFQDIKSKQSIRFPFQRVTDSEFPFSLDSVNVVGFDEDPTVALVNISIKSRARIPIPINRIIGNPNPLSLSSGASSALRLGSGIDFTSR
jgi:hypothetical protein